MRFFDKYDEYKILAFFEKIDRKTIKLKDPKNLLEYATAPWVYKKGKRPDYMDYAFATFLEREGEIKVPKNVKGLIIDGISEEILKGGSFKRWRVCVKVSRVRLLPKKKGSRIKPSHIALEYDNLGGGMLKFYLKDKKLAKLWSWVKYRLAGEDKNKDIFNKEIEEKEKEIVMLLEKATIISLEGDDKKEMKKLNKRIKKHSKQLVNFERFANVIINFN